MFIRSFLLHISYTRLDACIIYARSHDELKLNSYIGTYSRNINALARSLPVLFMERKLSESKASRHSINTTPPKAQSKKIFSTDNKWLYAKAVTVFFFLYFQKFSYSSTYISCCAKNIHIVRIPRELIQPNL